ncbi:MAG: type II toxin-antitoxin system RelE/ParE family toxin [Pseudomonadota bacterium]
MKVIWTALARDERAAIIAHIASDNPRAALRMDERFSDGASRLERHPKIGRPGKVTGTRELIPHESYRLVYEIDGDTVSILTLIHTSRLWPPLRE